MKNLKNSPAPWHIDGKPDNNRDCFIAAEGETCYPLATVMTQPIAGIQTANAKLIAAAPALLAACQAMLELFPFPDKVKTDSIKKMLAEVSEAVNLATSSEPWKPHAPRNS